MLGWGTDVQFMSALARLLTSVPPAFICAEGWAASSPPSYWINPQGTWLRVESQDKKKEPTSKGIAALGVRPGEFMSIRKTGSFQYNPSGSTGNGAIAVFRNGAARIAPGRDGAPPPEVTIPTCGGEGKPTDVAHDFYIPHDRWLVVQVPQNATNIAVGPNDCWWMDNSDPNRDFRVEIVPTYIVRKAANGGSPAKHVDLVILSEGYRYEERDKFEVDAAAFAQEFLSMQPFRRNRGSFNIVRITSPSHNSGARSSHEAPWKETFYRAVFTCDGQTRRLLCADEDEVERTLRRTVRADQQDIVLVLVNDGRHGGSGGKYAVASTAPLASQIAVHEIGHSFGHLDDEYDYGQCGAFRPWGFNVTQETDRRRIPWRRHIQSTTPIPTPGAGNRIGAYEGAFYCKKDWYRPTYDSAMRSFNSPFLFKAVNEEQLQKRIRQVTRVGVPERADVLAFERSARQHGLVRWTLRLDTRAEPDLPNMTSIEADAQAAHRAVLLGRARADTWSPHEDLGPNMLVVLGLDASGDVIVQTVVPDPRLRRFETAGENGRLEWHGQFLRTRAEFSVVLPADPRIAFLEIAVPPDGQGRATRTLARVDVR